MPNNPQTTAKDPKQPKKPKSVAFQGLNRIWLPDNEMQKGAGDNPVPSTSLKSPSAEQVNGLRGLNAAGVRRIRSMRGTLLLCTVATFRGSYLALSAAAGSPLGRSDDK